MGYYTLFTISENQEILTARQCAGYIFQENSHSKVLIKNQSVVDWQDDVRFAYIYIDLTEARRRLIHQYEIDILRKTKADISKLQQDILQHLLGC